MKTINPIVKATYTVFLAILITLFVGLGVSAFYPGPKQPEYSIAYEKFGEIETKEEKESRLKFENEQKEYEKKFAAYSRDVSMITLAFAILSLSVGLLLTNKIMIISDSLMVSGVFTLVYSIIRGFMTQDSRYRFLIVTVGLLVTVILGYIKFIKPREVLGDK